MKRYEAFGFAFAAPPTRLIVVEIVRLIGLLVSDLLTNQISPQMGARGLGYYIVVDVGHHSIQQLPFFYMRTLLSRNYLDGCMSRHMLERMNRIYPKNLSNQSRET